jgi:AraC family transcriptional regulator
MAKLLKIGATPSNRFPEGGVYLCIPMTAHPDILGKSIGHPVMAGELELMEERARSIPGSWRFGFHRHRRPVGMQSEDTGMLVYEKGSGLSGTLGLRFCITGHSCNRHGEGGCEPEGPGGARACAGRFSFIDVFHLDFGPVHLLPFVKGQRRTNGLQELLAFRMEGHLEMSIPMEGRITDCLREVSSHTYRDEHEDIYLNAQAQILMLYVIEALSSEEESSIPACKFLANELDREKIVRAREILIRHIGEPITIRELSRKVAINECYLKKGFKVLYGSTIFDFYQGQRMEHARYLLYEKGLSVSEVSLQLGYSSISHFSTAFKRHTGLKPCELLGR